MNSRKAFFVNLLVCLAVSFCCTPSQAQAGFFSDPTVTVDATPTRIRAKQPVTLQWSATDAKFVTINHAIGKVEPEGSLIVTPRKTTTYTVSAHSSALSKWRHKDEEKSSKHDKWWRKWGHAKTSVKITVVPYRINTAPSVDPQDITINEDTSGAITLTGSDQENDPFTFQIVSDPSHGSLTGTAPNLTYTPHENFHGTDSFTVTASDDRLTSAPTIISITVQPVNDAPVAENDILETQEDTSLTIGSLLGNDTDVDGDSLTITTFSQPAHGTLATSSINILIYTPHPNFHGTDNFSYTISDSNGGEDTASASITIISVNDAPAASAGNDKTIFCRDLVSLDGSASSDIDGDPLSYQWSFVSSPAGSAASLDNAGATQPTFTADQCGTYVVQLVVNDSFVDSSPDSVTIIAEPRQVNVPNLVGLSLPEAETAILGAGLTVGNVGHAYNDTVPIGLVIGQSLVAGSTVDERSPVALLLSLGLESSEPTISFTASPTAIALGESTTLSWSTTNATSVFIDNGNGLVPLNGSMLISPEHTTTYTLTATGPDGAANAKNTVMVSAPIIPQPEGVFGTQYEDLIPIDATVQEYSPERFALITGLVNDINNAPLADVSATMHSHPEYGTVFTDDEGRYTMPVQGGGNMTVVFQKDGFITSHRQANVPWNDIAITETVQLLEEDDKATTLTFDGNPNTVITHTSTEIVDEFGSRSATMVFTGDNRAYVLDKEGNEVQTLSTITTRATEYVTPESMPAALPPTSAFTYCSEFKVDGVERVRFAKPVTIYVDNFLGFDVGEVVPVGYYDRDRGLWVPSDNGVVVELLDTDGNGIVDALDGDGDGLADDLNQNGSYADEVIGLEDSTRYSHGSTFWRVSINHFTPIDCNWPSGLPPDTIPPNPNGTPDLEAAALEEPDPCEPVNSYVKKRGRVFHEDIPIPGTDINLHYASNRVEGYKHVLTVPVSGDSVPASLKGILVRVKIAGRTLSKTLEPLANQQTRFVWDSLDHLGRKVLGSETAQVEIGFVYQRFYYTAANFRQAFGQVGSDVTTTPGRQDLIIWKRSELEVNMGEGAKAGSLADGWTLSPLHSWKLGASQLDKGDGSQIKNNNGTIITTVAGNGVASFSGDYRLATKATLNSPGSLAIDAAGNLYIRDNNNFRIRKIDSRGIITTVAGNGSYGYSGDNGLATDASITGSGTIAVDHLGNLYIVERYKHSVRKVDSKGIITTVAGTGSKGFSGDNGPATRAKLSSPGTVVVDKAGNLFIADSSNYRVRKVDTNGIITTIAGNGTYDNTGNDGPATEIGLSGPYGLAVDQSGNLYISVQWDSRIRKIDPSGFMTTVAGNGISGSDGDYGLATEASIKYPGEVTVDSAGNIFFTDASQRIRKVDSTFGIITTVAGNGETAFNGDYIPAIDASFTSGGIAVDPAGNLFIGDRDNHRIRKVSLVPTFASHMAVAGDIPIADSNGLGYIMSASGLHKKTIDLESSTVLREFGYDSNENLISITDQFGNRITIERDSVGTPIAIVSADGLRTEIHIDTNNHLRQVVYPDNSSYDFTYSADGLMAVEVEPNGNLFEHIFDDTGRIVGVLDQEGGHWQYFRQSLDNGDVQIDSFTGEGNRVTNVEHTDFTGAFSFTTIDPSDDQTLFNRSAEGLTEDQTLTCGMISTTKNGLDPEYMFKFAKEVTTTSPAGLSILSSLEKWYEDINGDEIPDIISQTFTVNGKASVLTHNVLEAKRTFTSPLGRMVNELYDPTTLLTSSVNVPGLFDIIYGYDSKGRLTNINTGSRQASFVYNTQGFLESSTDALYRTTSYNYDPVGRVTSTTRPDNSTVYFTYDANGNMTVLTNPTPVDHGFTYNKVNKKSGYQTPLSGDYSYVYDRDRRLTQINFPSGYQINNVFNKNRLSQTQTPEGNIDYTYLSSKRVASITMGSESLAYGYDGSLVTSETMTGTLNQTLAYTYNNDFKVAGLSYGGYTNTITYDNDGLLTGLGLFSISRNAYNGLPESVYDSKLSLTRTFNGYGEIDSLTVSVGSSNIGSWGVTRNDSGRIVSKIDSLDGTTSTYTYDTLGRLLTVTKDSALVEEYRYNDNGSRIYEYNSRRGITGRNYSYSAEDHLLAAGSASYTYDADGFLATKTDGTGTTSYVYSSRGELLQTTLSDSTVIDYVHDPLGRRIAKKIDSVIVEKYLWLGQTTLLAVYDGNDNILMRFDYADGRLPLAMETGGSLYYLSYDQVSTLRTVTDTAGNIVKQIDYDTFGNILADTNSAFEVPFGFAGGLHDRHTGLVRFGYRDYAPEVGRWTAKDPIFFAGGDTDLFGYVQSDPVNLVDPEGLLWLQALGGLAGGVSSAISNSAAYKAGKMTQGEYYASIGFGALTGALSPGKGIFSGALAGLGNGVLNNGLSQAFVMSNDPCEKFSMGDMAVSAASSALGSGTGKMMSPLLRGGISDDAASAVGTLVDFSHSMSWGAAISK